MDIDSLWEYNDPAASEARFHAALDLAAGDERLELLTQIARALGLRDRFDEAHRTLDEVETQLDQAGPRPRVRYLLERGRVFNSSGDRDAARPLFAQAWDRACAAGLEGLAVDAAHMLAIILSGTPEAISWTRRGLDLARRSSDPKAHGLIPALLNNAAWDLHDTGHFAEALPLFEEAQAEWEARSRPQQIHIAKWSLARCLRSLGRFDEALAAQLALEAEDQAAGSEDGFVFEELAENFAALGKMDEARPYFQKAADVLGKDEWFVKNEAARLATLQRRAKE